MANLVLFGLVTLRMAYGYAKYFVYQGAIKVIQATQVGVL